MPLVHIHLLRSANRDAAAIRLLADTIQDVMQSHFNTPFRDRYQIVTQHDHGEIICEDSGLAGLPRSDSLVLLQIFQQGRSKIMKQETYRRLMEALEKNCGLGPGDLIVSVMENSKEDWSFGAGKAQFLLGQL